MWAVEDQELGVGWVIGPKSGAFTSPLPALGEGN